MVGTFMLVALHLYFYLSRHGRESLLIVHSNIRCMYICTVYGRCTHSGYSSRDGCTCLLVSGCCTKRIIFYDTDYVVGEL